MDSLSRSSVGSLSYHNKRNRSGHSMTRDGFERPNLHHSLGRDKSERIRRRGEINGVLPDSQFVVSENIKDKVHRRLYAANIKRNGIHDPSHKRINNLLGPLSVDVKVNQASNRVKIQNPLSELCPSRERLRSESEKIRETFFPTSPKTNNLSGYRIPKKSPVKVEEMSGEHTPMKKPAKEEPATLETRSRRRKIESDLESNTSDRLFDSMDGQISIRSSRSTTPDREHGRRRTSRRDFSTFKRQLNQQLKGLHNETVSEMSDHSSMVEVEDVDSEYHMSDTGSESSSYSIRVTRSRALENVDAVSVESGASSASKYSTRSKLSDHHWPRVFNTLHS